MDVAATELLLLAATAGQKHLRSITSFHLEAPVGTVALIEKGIRHRPLPPRK